jgi:hypothetical protein
MKNLKFIPAFFLTAVVLIFLGVHAADTSSTSTNSTASSKPIPYPLDTCVVSGDKLGEMGPPIVFVYSNKDVNQEIKFCCPSCKPDFLKDPDKYMKIIHDAEAKSKDKAQK